MQHAPKCALGHIEGPSASKRRLYCVVRTVPRASSSCLSESGRFCNVFRVECRVGHTGIRLRGLSRKESTIAETGIVDASMNQFLLTQGPRAGVFGLSKPATTCTTIGHTLDPARRLRGVPGVHSPCTCALGGSIHLLRLNLR